MENQPKTTETTIEGQETAGEVSPDKTKLSAEEQAILDKKYKTVTESTPHPEDDERLQLLKNIFNARKEEVEGSVKVVTDSEKGNQERIDSGVKIATETPIIGRILTKRIPLLSLATTINEFQQDVRDNAVSKAEVLTSTFKNIASSVTFGLSGILLGETSQETKKRKAREQELKTIPQSNQ
jgi:hypothetical protein